MGLLRSFEYLSASGPGEVTELPGSTSFTSALIHSLKALKEEKGCFTTSELLGKIDDHHDFPREQHPRLADRDQDMFTGRIMLHALPKPGECLGDSPTFIERSPSSLGQVLTLHVVFKEEPSNVEIEQLAHFFNDKPKVLCRIENIKWGGLRPTLPLQLWRD